jgi:predicted ATP-grasp superfamily ATP-dependent carboligase
MSYGPPAEQPTILITDAGRGSAIAFIRSLGLRGWRVIAADADPRSPGFRSRYTRDRLLYPAPETAPREFVQTVLQTVREKKVDLIVPITDAAIFPLSEARPQFEGLCRVAIPDAETLAVVTNKLKTLELAERLGVPAPFSVLVSTAQEAVEQWQGRDWPVVLKPRASRLYHDRARVEAFTVAYAADGAQLARQMQPFEGRCPVLLQEYYPGQGHGVELLMDRGRPLAAFQHKRLREVPVNGGASAFRESVALDPKMYDDSVRLLEALNWTGLAMVEFKLGACGPKLMGSMAGCNLAATSAAAWMLGRPGRSVLTVRRRTAPHCHVTSVCAPGTSNSTWCGSSVLANGATRSGHKVGGRPPRCWSCCIRPTSRTSSRSTTRGPVWPKCSRSSSNSAVNYKRLRE